MLPLAQVVVTGLGEASNAVKQPVKKVAAAHNNISYEARCPHHDTNGTADRSFKNACEEWRFFWLRHGCDERTPAKSRQAKADKGKAGSAENAYVMIQSVDPVWMPAECDGIKA